MSSMCLSVTLVDCDHIGWNSSEIIPPLGSMGCSLSADPNIGAEMEPGHGSPGQQFGSGSGRVTGQNSDPDFDPGSCSMQ